MATLTFILNEREPKVLSQSFFLKNIVPLGPSFHHKNTERDP
jgi:hypothetical protein